MGRGDLSDQQWSVLEPLLPVVGVGRPARNRRRLIDGARWRVRTGAPWRDLPVMPAANCDHPIETPVRRTSLKIGTTTASEGCR
uniref:transposase n=1 Tax=Streptomyces chromofuscus TaxID=42881 RepID=UPI00357135AC